ncbi:hypothetical protein D3C76_973320 [compost metagenome]
MQLHPLAVAGRQIQGIQFRPLGIDFAGQGQGDWRLLGGQAGAAGKLIALEQVTLGIELELIQLQRVGQRRRWLEGIGADLHLGRQVFGQRLHAAGKVRSEVAAAGRVERQGFLQLTLGGQCQLPGLPLHLG